MTERQIKKLLAILDSRDHSLFREYAAELSPNQLVAFQTKHKHKDFEYVLWSASPTWGFEVLWAEQYSLPEDQRDSAVDLPELESLTPDKPLDKHFMWAPQDQLTRLA
ncbi:hypothetical protein Lepto7375DRAFT_0602 [Leptolyngbya sp. PCC 7375]|nr:hypothetical protein Lepto7375DRAFT_0602 [Leptolyngbya sp. PCC 7375]